MFLECEEYSNLSQISRYPSYGFVGGVKTNKNEFPHMSAIGTREGRKIIWTCGASLISEDFVVTAAHCSPSGSSNVRSLVVRVGDMDLKRDDDGAEPQEFGVRRVIVHPDYNVNVKYNDIALMQLNRKAL